MTTVQSTVDKVAKRVAFSSDSPRKSVVLFGIDSCRAKKGQASAPRKALVKPIASRTAVGVGVLEASWAQTCAAVHHYHCRR